MPLEAKGPKIERLRLFLEFI